MLRSSVKTVSLGKHICVGLASGAFSVVKDGFAGMDPVRTFTTNSLGSISAPPLAKAEPNSISENKHIRGETVWVTGFVLGAIFCFGEGRTGGQTTIQKTTIRSLKLVRKKLRRHAGAAVSFWPVTRWQAEPLWSLEINDREKMNLKPMEKPMLE